MRIGRLSAKIRTIVASFLLAVALAPQGVSPAIAAEAAAPAILTVKTPKGERGLTLTEIESLGTRLVVTRSPWETGELKLQGVLLRDLLAHVGLAEAEAVIVRGEDDYTQVVPDEDWENWPVLLATRQDGKPLTRRTQGPTRLVYPLNDHPELDTDVYGPRWVWVISSIEAATP